MPKYRKKPVVVEAIQYKGAENIFEVQDFFGEENGKTFCYQPLENMYSIRTLEGDMLVNEGDYIIKGIKGEFYPCKPDIFEQTYERVLSSALL